MGNTDNALKAPLMLLSLDELINLFVTQDDFNDESYEEYCMNDDDHVNIDFKINTEKE